MAKKTFNIADYVQPVSNSDTMEIRMIPWDHIQSNEANFYDVSDVDELVASIEMHGLMDPVVVIADTEKPDMWVLISGHRRHKAWGILRDKNVSQYAEIPAVVRSFESPTMAELALIMANGSARVLSSAEISRQAERVEMLFYELKEQGYEFPGRMRDRVAAACKVSASKLARLKVIRENLIPKLKKAWEAGSISESVAYDFAKHPEELQRDILSNYSGKIERMTSYDVNDRATVIKKVSAAKCGKEANGQPCENSQNMLERIYGEKYRYHYSECKYGGCCAKCNERTKCTYVCSKLQAQIAKEKAKARDAKKEEKSKEAEKTAKINALTGKLWQQFGAARRRALMNPTAAKKAVGISEYFYDNDRMKRLELGLEKINLNTRSPYSMWSSEVEHIIKAADAFGCSTDFLLGRTDDLQSTPATNPQQITSISWHHCLVDEPEDGQKVLLLNPENFYDVLLCTYCGGQYIDYITEDAEEVNSTHWWIPIPEEATDE